MKRLLIFLFLLPFCLSLAKGQNIHPTRTLSQAYTTYTEQGVSGIFNNQAGLYGLTKLSIEASYLQRYFSEGISELNLGAAIPINPNTSAALYVKRFGDDIFSEQSAGLGMGRKLSENFSMGIGLEVYQLSIENHGSRTQFNTQLGFQAQVTKAIKIGTHLYLPLESEDILTSSNQAILNFDIAVQADKQLQIKGGIRKVTDQDVGIKAALTYKPLEIIEIHTGILSNPTHYNFGVGIEIFKGGVILVGSQYQPDLGWSSGLNFTYAPKK